MRRRGFGCLDPGGRGDFGLYLHPGQFPSGEYLPDSFWDVWQNRFDKFRDREWARKGECADCKMWRFCLGGGMHLHDDQEHLMYCHYKRLQ